MSDYRIKDYGERRGWDDDRPFPPGRPPKKGVFVLLIAALIALVVFGGGCAIYLQYDVYREYYSAAALTLDFNKEMLERSMEFTRDLPEIESRAKVLFGDSSEPMPDYPAEIDIDSLLIDAELATRNHDLAIVNKRYDIIHRDDYIRCDLTLTLNGALYHLPALEADKEAFGDNVRWVRTGFENNLPTVLLHAYAVPETNDKCLDVTPSCMRVQADAPTWPFGDRIRAMDEKNDQTCMIFQKYEKLWEKKCKLLRELEIEKAMYKILLDERSESLGSEPSTKKEEEK